MNCKYSRFGTARQESVPMPELSMPPYRYMSPPADAMPIAPRADGRVLRVSGVRSVQDIVDGSNCSMSFTRPAILQRFIAEVADS